MIDGVGAKKQKQGIMTEERKRKLDERELSESCSCVYCSINFVIAYLLLSFFCNYQLVWFGR